MNSIFRKSLIGTFALVASLSTPLAFAQSAQGSTQTTPPTETSAQTATSAQGTAAATETSTSTGTAAASDTSTAPAKKSWSDVDADKDGKLTKAEAGTVPALGQVFDRADGNADGALTADEYKAYVAHMQGGDKGKGDGK